MTWLLNWISVPGFWRGVTYLVMAAGITLEPMEENSIIAAGLAISGLIHAFASGKAAKEK